MDAPQVLAFRFARSGLASREGRSLVEAAACPASDFARDAALLALAARAEGVTRERYDAAVAAGELFLAHSLRCALHALRPGDLGAFGRSLVGADDRELKAQLGEVGVPQSEALVEVTAAVADALRDGPLGKDDLHEALRARVRAELLPWCESCRSHHVAGSLWRYAAVAAGARLDGRRRYVLARPAPEPDPARAVRAFLRFYGPGTPAGFGAWAGVTPSHAKRLWQALRDELVEIEGFGWLLREDEPALASPPEARGVRLLPPGDPFLQRPNRELLAPDPDLRKRLFRPAGSPGAVLLDGRLAGLWRKRSGEFTVEPLTPLPEAELEDEVRRLGEL